MSPTVQWGFYLMRQLSIIVFAAVFCTIGILDARSQTTTVTQTTKQSETYSYGNSSGFSIANNGTLIYPGPLVADWIFMLYSATLTEDERLPLSMLQSIRLTQV